ncbi:S41 family peptidase [Algoriphagus sp. CAU 1675]|uniref:S41 family peptidase n=1 Tax=Algoriphagus sp. CAU 1675 TaxID=3032597 RepID=UPI0023DA639B|nr:S41 family peptidase [Algoriphagus sp. CAU 1675]MDF2157295.1 S41 family peptidase [Algoriphagus sp. CAU 1675]
MKKGYLLILILLLTLPSFGQKKFSKQEVIEDLQYLRESLEEAHYNLYTYVTKEAFNQNFENIRASITSDSLSLLETTNLFQAVISKANNGHTEIPFPVSSYIAYAGSEGTVFPLELAFEDGKALIRKNFSNLDSLEIGTEVISINQRTINQVLSEIYPLISAERRYFKLAKLELFSFPRLYWQAYGEQKNFEVEVKKDGAIKIYQLNSVHLINDFESKRNEIWSETRDLQILNDVAYLKPGNFGGDEQKFRQFIDSAFVEINSRKLPDLIIDLRNNLGGDDFFSNYLVSYIADKPFLWNSEFTLKTSAILKAHVEKNYDTTEPYWENVMTHEDGSIYTYEFEAYNPQPEDKRYTGNVYVLVNRQSHSQAAVIAAQIQDYKFATIVGEQTGDFPSLLASQYGYFLPHTGIEVKISKGYIVRVNGSKKAEGVIPDIYIKDHLIDENDEILDELLERIKKNH